MAPAYEIDQSSLMSSYQQLQTEYHPDRFVNSVEQDKRLAMQITSHINEAYKTLYGDQTRARYLLQLAGVVFDADKDTTQDMDFLVTQMTLREAIDQVDNCCDPLAELDDLSATALEQKKQLIETFKGYYSSQQFDQAKEAVLKMQFFNRLHNQIASKQEALEDEMI